MSSSALPSSAIGLEARHEAALGLGFEQAAAFGTGLGIGTKIDLRRLKGVAHAGMQSQRVDRAASAACQTFHCAPSDPLKRSTSCAAAAGVDDASAVDARFVAGFTRAVPAQPGQQAGARRRADTGFARTAPGSGGGRSRSTVPLGLTDSMSGAWLTPSSSNLRP